MIKTKPKIRLLLVGLCFLGLTPFVHSAELATLSGTDGFALNGVAGNSESGDAAGHSVANAGNMNGDGYDDLVVCAPSSDSDTLSGKGRCYVVYGHAGVNLAEIELSSLDGSNGFVIEGANSSDKLGASVSSAGDFNNDGYDDLLIGSVDVDTAATNAGASYLIFGGSSLPALLTVDTLDGSNGITILGLLSGDKAGSSVAGGGDLNGDGFSDIAIGATNADPNGLNSGQAYVVLGHNTIVASIDLSVLDGTDGFVINGPAAFGVLGSDVAIVGDLDFDGFDDAAFAAPSVSEQGLFNSGAVYIVFGTDLGFPSVFETSDLDGVAGLVIAGGNASDSVGQSVGPAGDVNGDGIDDLVLGAAFADGGEVDSGQSFLIFGSSTIPALIDLGALNASTGVVINGIIQGDRLGSAVSGGTDFNWDGFDDVLLGAPNAGSLSGQTYVIYGESSLPAVINLSQPSIYHFALSGVTSGDEVGSAVGGLGDYNNDGYDEILIGSPGSDPAGRDNAGQAYLVFGDGVAPVISTIADQTVATGASTGVINFTVEDLETGTSGIVVQASSDDQSVVADANIVLGGSGGNRTVSVTAGLTDGTATITITATDLGGSIGNQTFLVTASTDTDGDGVPDLVDDFPNDPTEWEDTDGDGVGNNADTDDDNDLMPDVFEVANGLDPLDSTDATGDLDNDSISNLDEFLLGTDPNNPDTDGDLFNDDVDDFPTDPTESVDTDGDGVGDNADLDDDNDLMPDIYEQANGLDPLDSADATADLDNDGISNFDEFLLGTSPNNVDSDGDSIDDGIDNCPLIENVGQDDENSDGLGNACDPSAFVSLTALADVTGNGISEIAALHINGSGVSEVQINDPGTSQLVSSFTMFNADWQPLKLLALDDLDAVALLALDQTNLVQGIQIKDATNGALIRNLFPWSAAWDPLDADLVPGEASGGLAAIATLATRTSDGLMGVELRDPANGSLIRIIYPLGLGWTAKELAVVTAGGVPAIAVLATRDSDGLTIVQVRNASDGSLIDNVFPLGLGFSPQELKAMPDINGDGSGEIAVRMTRDSDGLELIQIRDSATNVFIKNVYPIGAGFGGWRTQQFEVLDYAGTTVLGVLSLGQSDTLTLVQMRNPLSGGIINNTFFIGAPWKYRDGFTIVPDFSGNEYDELAAINTNSSNGDRLVQVRDAVTTVVLKNISQP